MNKKLIVELSALFCAFEGFHVNGERFLLVLGIIEPACSLHPGFQVSDGFVSVRSEVIEVSELDGKLDRAKDFISLLEKQWDERLDALKRFVERD